MTEQTALAQTLCAVVQWLQGCRKDRLAAAQLRQDFAQLCADHPGLPLHLLIHSPPAATQLELDVLLAQEAGNLSLSWQEHSAQPWSTGFADHWAANFVLSVDDADTTIQSALLYLNSVLRAQPNLMEALIRRSLISAAMQQMGPDAFPVDALQLEQAVDQFRAGQRLFSADAMQRWLDETQLTMPALQDMIRQNLQLEMFRDNIVAPDIEAFFAAHQAQFTRLRLFVVAGLPEQEAQQLAQQWRATQVCPLLHPDWQGQGALATAKMETVFCSKLAAPLQQAKVGQIIGPYQPVQPVTQASQFAVAHLLARQEAQLDKATRAVISDMLFASWLKDKRAAAKVRWHWM